ncbi:hypothetical protein M413DRAFT_10909 [Hebeloma cylindrosporum]|uniref:non-specific serine/threonine protein kinase n=1 Tax=Hebeloma cylindrosporum TaxID=76867 RepID=A0A0C3CCD1_HEBCY|nr:hypothetical protein M413DRAFT_10909 [Hebeloma cylindrosporum h7]
MEAEEVERYCRWGYPIIVGDIITTSEADDERGYRIMHKLGWGSYATVWLAEKTDPSAAFVAVKISKGEEKPTKELAMLEAAVKFQTSDNGQSLHVPTLLDHFTLRGPNGTHSVLVTDIIAPFLSRLRSLYRDPLWSKTAGHGITKAVVSLHAAGIVHGDLHLSNIGFALPQITDQDHQRVLDDIAHEVGTLPLSFQCARKACAPELAFARTVEKIDNPPVEPPADFWALGTAIYEIIVGSPLFHGRGISSLPHSMLAMTSSVPSEWKNWYANLSKPPEVSSSRADEWWESRRKVLRLKCVDEASADALTALLRKVLVLDPASRPTAAEVLQGTWDSSCSTIAEKAFKEEGEIKMQESETRGSKEGLKFRSEVGGNVDPPERYPYKTMRTPHTKADLRLSSQQVLAEDRCIPPFSVHRSNLKSYDKGDELDNFVHQVFNNALPYHFAFKMDCDPNPDMQGFTVRLAKNHYEPIRMCFYALFFQLFPIIIGTLVSFIQGKLTAGDAWFALLVMLSPTTLDLLDLLPYNIRHVRQWSRREVIDGISITILLVLSIVLYIVIVVFLSANFDSCPLVGFYSTNDSPTYVFAIALLTVCFTIFHVPGYRSMKYLLSVLLWSPARGFRASMIISIMFSVIEGLQVLGAVQPKCAVERWRSKIGRTAMAIAIFADPTGAATKMTIALCLLGELCAALPANLPVFSWVQISASWIGLMSEAATRIHPGRGAFQSALFYAQWGLVLEVTTLEVPYELTYGQIVASLSFLPISAECLKVAFRRRHELTLHSLRLAALPLWPTRYKELSKDDVFPKEFWKTKTRTGVIASILGLSWAGCAVADRLPSHTAMRTIAYSAYPSIRFPERPGDYAQDDSPSPSNRLHEPIEMKTMLPSKSARPKKLNRISQGTPLSSDSTLYFLSEELVQEPDGLSDKEETVEENVIVRTGRDNSTLGAATIRSRASLPKPVTSPSRRTFWGLR